MTRMQRHVAGAAAFCALATAAFFWAVADGDQAVIAATTQAMGAPPAHFEALAPVDVLERAKHEAKIEELPPQF